eukprot:2220931-Prymnesium_polylepis.1
MPSSAPGLGRDASPPPPPPPLPTVPTRTTRAHDARVHTDCMYSHADGDHRAKGFPGECTGIDRSALAPFRRRVRQSMAYRCGWTLHKDLSACSRPVDQQRFDELPSQAAVSSSHLGVTSESECRATDVKSRRVWFNGTRSESLTRSRSRSATRPTCASSATFAPSRLACVALLGSPCSQTPPMCSASQM